MPDELLEVVDETGRVIGLAPRSLVHADRSLLHRVAHVLVVNRAGEILLQKRSTVKTVAPGKWDTSVGGHLEVGETPETAARREMEEELGATGEIEFLYTWIWRDTFESELVTSYLCRHEGPFRCNLLETEELCFLPVSGINERLGSGLFTAQFEEEFTRYLTWLGRSASE